MIRYVNKYRLFISTGWARWTIQTLVFGSFISAIFAVQFIFPPVSSAYSGLKAAASGSSI